MSNFFILDPTFFHSILRVSTPLILAGMSAVITGKVGIINISIEGVMLGSALAGVLFSYFSASAFIGVLGAVFIGVMMSIFFGYFTINLKTNSILSGLAVNILASSGTIFVMYMITSEKSTTASIISGKIPNIEVPIVAQIPIISQILSGQNLLTYLAFFSVWFMYFLLYKTKLGLRIRACGENEKALNSVGVSIKKTQYIALIISGVFCGLAGAFMSMSYVSWFSRDMIAGRGFIALSACAMGGISPKGTLISALLFAVAEAMSASLQIYQIPVQFVQMLPYLITIIGIVVHSIFKNKK